MDQHPSHDQPSRRPTDSPWFWLSVFVSAALISLALAAPKYSWRQPQIERRYQARERSGQTISARGGPQPLAATDRPLLSLQPLVVFLATILCVACVVFWWVRWRRLID